MRRHGASIAVVLAGAAALPLMGCGADEYRSLVAGECLPADAQVIGRREADPPRVPCGVAHRYEVFWVGPLDGDDRYPGEAALDALAARTCAQRFTPVVGIEVDAIPDGTQLLRLQPSEESWNDGDRDVECIVAFEADRSGRLGEGDET